MSLARIARHRAWRMLPLWLLAAGVNTSALVGILSWRAVTRNEAASTLSLTLVAWIGVATYLAFSEVRTRCSHFEMSLPVASRRLWRNSLFATLAGGLSVIGLTLGVMALHAALPTPVELVSHLGTLAFALCAGLLLATLLLQAPTPSLFRIPVNGVQIVWTVVVLAGTPFWLAFAVEAGWPGLFVLVLLVVGTALWSYRSVPPTYSLTPLQARSAARADTPYVASEGPPSRLLLPIAVLRSVSAGPKELLAVPFILFFGLVVGGGLLAFEDIPLRELRFLYLPMTTYMLFALCGPRLASLHRLDPLPISRRWLVAALVLPYFSVLCVGYGVGAWLASEPRSRLEYVDFVEGDEGYHVTVPLRVYELTREGEPPPIVAPWGESHAVKTHRLFTWSRTRAFQPYSAPPGSSARFVALQIHRAVEAFYGASIPPQTIEARYLITREDGSVAPRDEGPTLRSDYPGLRPVSGPMLPVLLAVTVVPWLLLSALLLRAYRARVREWVRQTIVWGSLAFMLALVLAASVASVGGGMRYWAIRALVEIPVMQLGRTPVGTFGTWLVAALLLVAAYRLVHVQFLRMEIPTHPSRYTLIRVRQD